MMRRAIITAFLSFSTLLFAGTFSDCSADDAEVLPKGVFSISVTGNYYPAIKERYNDDGDKEDLALDYNASLNSSIFTELETLEQAFAATPFAFSPDNPASLGDSVVKFEYETKKVELLLAYGVTDKLTVGIYIPYLWLKNNVKARLDQTNATVVKNSSCYGNTTNPVCNALGITETPIIPKSMAEFFGLPSDPFVTEDVLQFLTDNYGYERFETWSDDGLGDIEAGFKYQYLKTDKWKLAFTGAVRFPTGRVDDPDNLVDRDCSYGVYALLFRLHNDYRGIKNLVLNATFRYDLMLPDKEVKRVPDSVDQPITNNKEKVERDLGDFFQFEVSGNYEFTKGLNGFLMYNYTFGLEDEVSGDKGFAYKSLEDETDPTSHEYKIGLSYSSIPLFAEKKFPLPFTTTLSYRQRFAGSNALNSKYVALGLQFYF